MRCSRSSWRISTRCWGISLARCASTSSVFAPETRFWSSSRRTISRAGALHIGTSELNHESPFISQENLYEVQDRPASGRDPHHLRSSEAQAATGIKTFECRMPNTELIGPSALSTRHWRKHGTYRWSRSPSQQTGRSRPDLYLRHRPVPVERHPFQGDRQPRHAGEGSDRG